MADEQTNTITVDVLHQARENTDKILAQKNLSRINRAIFENYKFTLLFIEDSYKKTSEMYPYYLEQKKQRERFMNLNNAILLFLLGDIITRIMTFLFTR